MIWFEFTHTDYHSLLASLAEKLGTHVTDDCLRIPPTYGSGSIRALRLPNGLSVCVVDNTVTTDIILKRVKKEPCYFILAFDDFRIGQSLQQVVDGEKEYYRPPIYAGVSLTSTMIENTLIAAKDFSMRSIRVMFPTSWLARYFKIEKDDELLAEYLQYKTKKLTLEPLDIEYRKLMDDVFSVDEDSPVYYATLENRVMLMMERFFSRLAENVKEARFKRLDKSDIYKMMQVESELADPGLDIVPRAKALAEKFEFSETKLKRMFREVYGVPLYEYYQRCRLERARELLELGQMSVKQTGLAVGYKSLSNFSKAFKHIYGMLPGEIAGSRVGQN